MTTKNWSITQLQVYPQSEGEADVVCAAAWNVSGTDGTYSGSLNGSTAFKLDPEAPFIPYDQLTQEQVLEWVWGSLGEEGKASAEADVDAQIAYAAEQVSTPPLPWGTAA
jgi:hypothetical protein